MWAGRALGHRAGRQLRPGPRPAGGRWREPTQGAICVYAQGDDYHELIKGAAEGAGRAGCRRRFGGEVKVFVDTAPLMEKPLAERAGLGWQGKHTNLVSREFGSWLFLGSILTTLELAPDAAEADHCGTCRACLDICPTNAFPAPYQLDARRCISYLTIEHEGPDPARVPRGAGQPHLRLRRLPGGLPLEQVRQPRRRAEAAGARGPARAVAGRAGRAWTTRPSAPCSPRARSSASAATASCATCSTRSATRAKPALAAEAERLLDDPSPLVRGAAVWALGRLLPAAGFKALRIARTPGEPDADVAEEWSFASSAHFREGYGPG